MTGPLRSPLAVLLVLAVALLLAPGFASAEALVVVKLRDKAGKAADGKVSLKTAEGKIVASCETESGTCEMASVPGGNYKAHVEPRTGEPPKPKSVMIPPAGKVSLIVATGT